MTPDDEPTPTGDTTETTTEESSVEETPDGDGEGIAAGAELTDADESTDGADEDDEDDEADEGVEAEGTLLEQSQATIDDAREAVKKVAATDAIGEDATGAGDLPAFADSTEGVEKPDPDDA
jgi:hypothetical protein